MAWRPRRGGVATALRPLAWLYALLAALHRAWWRHVQRPVRLPVPVVVVGNVVVGGSGKTPVVIALVQTLRAAGWNPGVVSRGYGRASGAALRLAAPDSTAEQIGDEPLLIGRRTGAPLAVGARRVDAARLLLARHPEVDIIVSDDGLQHHALAHDLALVVFDDRGAGNGLLLPAGPLREPLSDLDTMDALVLNGDAPPPRAHPRVFRFTIEATGMRRLDGTEHCSPSAFAQRAGTARIAALAGIAQPARFFATLRGIVGAFDAHALGDHAQITPATIAALDADLVVMTEKDAVKCAAFADPRCWALEVHARFDPALLTWLEEHLNGPSPA